MMTIFFYSQNLLAQPCVTLDEDRTNRYFEEGAFHQGCSPVSFCIGLFNNPDNEVTIEEVVIRFMPGVGANPNFEFLIAENLNDFSPQIDGSFVGVFSVPISEESTSQFCIDFSVDEAYSPQAHGPIRTAFRVEQLGTTCDVIDVEMPIITPFGVEVIEEDEEVTVSNLILSGRLLPADISDNSGQRIVNRGIIIVDIPEYGFYNNTRIYMDENAKIQIADGSHLRLADQTKVLGCFDMWNSIEVEGGGKLTVQDLVEIRDGIQAIKAFPNSIVDIQDAEFMNNQVGIYTNDGENVSWTVDNNTFQSDALLPPFEGQIGKAGIEVNGVNGDLGTNILIANDNDFFNLANGIIGNGSNLGVFGGSFVDMRTDNNYTPRGNGIYMFGSSDGNILFQAGNGNDLADPTFDNCEDGIFLINMHSFIQDNAMVNVQKGVRVWLSNNRTTNIRTSAISASEIGIDLFRNQPQLQSSRIVENDIIIDGDIERSTGIRMKDFPAGHGFIIEDNQIDVQNARFGMDISGASNTDLKRNNIRLENESNSITGIRIEGSENLEVDCNRVSKTNESISSDQFGIYFNSVSNSLFDCNDFENVRYGIQLDDMNDASFVQGNVFENYYHGLVLEKEAITSPHNHRGNIWGTAFNNQTAGALHEGKNENIAISRFFVDTGDNQNFLPNETNNTSDPDATVDWFVNQVNNPEPFFTCPTGSICPDLSNEEWIPNQLDEIIATGGQVSVDYAEEQLWKAQDHLYKRLQDNPQWTSVNQILKDFMDDNGGSHIKIIREVTKDIEEIVASGGNTKVLTNTILSKTNELRDVLLNGNPTQSIAVQDLLEDISVAQFGLQSIVETIDDNLDNSLDLIGINLAFNTDKVYEENAKIVRQIYLASLATSSINFYTPAQKIQLENIAYQCPFTGGDAVYIARGMLGLTNTFDNDVLCVGSQNSVAPLQNNPNTIANFSIFPNPANKTVTVQFEEEFEIEGELSLINSLGQIIQSLNIEEGAVSKNIDLTNVPNGLYFLHVNKPNQTTQVTTLKVVK